MRCMATCGRNGIIVLLLVNRKEPDEVLRDGNVTLVADSSVIMSPPSGS